MTVLLDLALLLPPPQQAVDPTQVFSTCPAGHFLDCVQDLFLMLAQGWMQRAVRLARVIFTSLAGLEMAVTGWVYWTRRGSGEDDVVGSIAVKLGVLAFLLGVLGSYSYWVPMIPYILGMSAAEIGGAEVAELSVTGLAARGWEIGIMHIARPSFTGAIFDEAGGLLGIGAGLLDFGVASFVTNLLILTVASFVNLITGVFIFFVFMKIAIWLLVAMIESYVAIGGGIFFAGMLAFRGTAPMFSGYLQYLAYVAVRLFFLILIAGAALSIGTALSTMIASGQVPDSLDFGVGNATGLGVVGKARLSFSLAIAAIAYLLFALAKVLPDRIAKQVSSVVSVDMKTILKR